MLGVDALVRRVGDNGCVRVTILGPFEVRSDAGDSLPVAGARLRDLITRLALAGGKPVSTSALAEAVWADQPPADLANALQTLVSRARRALGGPAAIEQSPAGYRLAVTPDDVDALRFEHLAADGHVEEALALWRGAALEDAGDFAAPYARRLEQLKLDATITSVARPAHKQTPKSPLRRYNSEKAAGRYCTWMPTPTGVELSPTAMHAPAFSQATPSSAYVPLTIWTGPTTPSASPPPS